MRTAGVVFDFYDDLSGAVLKKSCPNPSDLPDIVKEAHILSPEEREVLRDEAFALTMVNNGTHLRKFACVDAGNTALSVLYFTESADMLSHQAVKTAASNLIEACHEFELPVPEWLKTAAKTGMSKTRNPSRQPTQSDDVEWHQRTNLTSIQGGADSGRVIPTASQMKTAGKENKNKNDVNLDSFHKLNPEAKPKDKEAVSKEWISEKVLSGMSKIKDPVRRAIRAADSDVRMGRLNSKANLKPAPEHLGSPLAHRELKRKHLKDELSKALTKKSSVVDISGQTPELQVKRASAQLTALGGKYPLDSMADVQKAVSYFEENYKEMEPIEAHIFAVKTAARAEEIGLPSSETLQRYGSTEYAIDVDAHLANRLSVAPPEYTEVYKELREKRASIEPEEFASLLAEADEISGLKWVWGGEVADPYYATFGKQAAAWSWTGRTGDYVSEEELRWLARNGRPLIHKHFASDFTNSFIKDPISIFESMPDDSKVILARLANGKFDAMNAN